MLRGLALLLVTAVAAVAAGCGGADAQEAQTLLTQADTAFAQVKSATFTARLTMTGGPQELAMAVTGGGYVRGRHAGDYYMVATAENLPWRELVLTSKAGRISMTLDGSQIGNVPAPPQGDDKNPLRVAEYSRYVKEVKVEHGKLIDGESMAKISGVIDMAGLTEGLLSNLTGGGGLDLSDTLGDMRVVLYISETTHLPLRGLIDVPLEVLGQKLELHLDYAYTAYNEPVEFP